MGERLLSVGLDVGTTSTQMIVSELVIENEASGFAVPKMRITERRIRYRSPVYFTPLVGENLVDGRGIRALVEQEYARAGITREDVDTGAVIITGETSRRENAAAVLTALSEYAGDFVVATAGPDLESVLAAKGSGAVDYSRETGRTVLHMDIGGGTSNLALIREGRIVETGCLNIGGRLIKVDPSGIIRYVSPVLKDICSLKTGDRADLAELERVAQRLAQILEMAAGLREDDGGLAGMTTEGTAMEPPKERVTVSFSGGVADCIKGVEDSFAFGDIGPILGRAIGRSRLCRGDHRFGEETIRATVIGAGCHSAQLSGSTIYCKDVSLPLKNRPVVMLSRQEQTLPRDVLVPRIRGLLEAQDTEAVLYLPGFPAPEYGAVRALAEAIAEGVPGRQVLVALREDMAKALGQAIALNLAPGRGCLCVDSVELSEGSYLDLGLPAGPALPLVVKTLILSH